ncbi:hypothetical protein CYMTET_49486 [Cymbomonas tetramitiformis]|uniref:Uncharacterized protein n=1 Tax=Cymbomonas tetramitiformis TaxID=36881 RepID=A0AAE0BQ43_9CHLO|nr:hypothetical protein CYMTET_49486 [Cymbomonas tetramitiformis]
MAFHVFSFQHWCLLYTLWLPLPHWGVNAELDVRGNTWRPALAARRSGLARMPPALEATVDGNEECGRLRAAFTAWRDNRGGLASLRYSSARSGIVRVRRRKLDQELQSRGCVPFQEEEPGEAGAGPNSPSKAHGMRSQGPHPGRQSAVRTAPWPAMHEGPNPINSSGVDPDSANAAVPDAANAAGVGGEAHSREATGRKAMHVSRRGKSKPLTHRYTLGKNAKAVQVTGDETTEMDGEDEGIGGHDPAERGELAEDAGSGQQALLHEMRVPGRCYKSVSGRVATPSIMERVHSQRSLLKEMPDPAPKAIAKVSEALSQLPSCILATRSCAPPSFLSSIMREVPGTLAQGPPVQLIDLQPGSLGTCALVGSGDTILEKHFGGEIDAHDTVIRYNSPTSENYRRHVGSKTSFLIYKELYRSRGQEEASQLLDAASKPRAYILNQKQVLKHAPRLRFRGRPVLALGPDANKVDGIGAAVYTAYLEASGMSSHIGSKLRRATTGFKRALGIVASQLCSRIDMYGFSSGGGKYFARSSEPFSYHVLAAEHFAFRVLMAQQNVCVYGD